MKAWNMSHEKIYCTLPFVYGKKVHQYITYYYVDLNYWKFLVYMYVYFFRGTKHHSKMLHLLHLMTSQSVSIAYPRELFIYFSSISFCDGRLNIGRICIWRTRTNDWSEYQHLWRFWRKWIISYLLVNIFPLLWIFNSITRRRYLLTQLQKLQLILLNIQITDVDYAI